MATCPACGSSRIRNGYHSAPLPLRLCGIRELLCDNCNLQFRAFAPRPPRRHKARQVQHSTNQLIPAPAFDLAPAEETEAAWRIPIGADFDPSPAPAAVNGQPLADTTKTLADTTKATEKQFLPVMLVASEEEELAARAAAVAANAPTPHSSSALRACPKCNSTETHRRHRRTWERVVFAFTSIRPYRCEDCGGSFYARRVQHHAAGNRKKGAGR